MKLVSNSQALSHRHRHLVRAMPMGDDGNEADILFADRIAILDRRDYRVNEPDL